MEINQKEQNAKLENIKSRLILKKLFNHLKIKNSLGISKYNNKLKKIINLNINDYKEYSEKYSSIEIEIKPVINKYGKFINIKNKEEIYYHIYFNNDKKEIKRNYLDDNDSVSKIKIIIDYQVKSFKELFYNCECIEYIYFKKFYRNNIDNMGGMFNGCCLLKD